MIWQYPGLEKGDHHRFLLPSEDPFRKEKGGDRQLDGDENFARPAADGALISVVHTQVFL